MTDVVPIRLGIVNAFLVRDGRKGALVDAGLPGREERILRVVRAAGVEVSAIVLTHGHPDHVGSADALHRVTGAPVLLGKADADPPRPLKGATPMGRVLAPFFGARRASVKADRLVDAPFDLAEFGVRARVEPTPGHTPGSLSVVTQGGDAIVGDLVGGGIAWRRRLGLPLFADDLDELRRQVRRVAALPIERVHVGHGGPTFPRAVLARLG